MARNFTITNPSETVRVGPDGRGEMTFTVTNVSGFPARGLAKVVPLGTTSAEWLTLTEVEREFPVGGVQQFRVGATIPPGTAAGRYTWRFDMVSAAKSGEGSDVGPTVAFEVAPSEKKKKGIPWWVWVAIALGVIVIAVVAWLFMRPGPPPPPPPPPPEIVRVKVPSLEGRDLGNAILVLQSLDLTPRMEPSFVRIMSNKVNKVVKQDPAPGMEVEKGATVTIVVLQLRGKFNPPIRDHRVKPSTQKELERFRKAVESQ